MNNQSISEEDYWIDIFDGITSDVVPFQYVESVSIVFTNNKTWEIPVENPLENWDKVQEQIEEFISHHAKQIDNIGYNVDLLQVKNDITILTDQFLKNLDL